MVRPKSAPAEENVFLSMKIPKHLKVAMTDAAWSLRVSRSELLRSFLEEHNFLKWAAARTLRIVKREAK